MCDLRRNITGDENVAGKENAYSESPLARRQATDCKLRWKEPLSRFRALSTSAQDVIRVLSGRI